MLLDGHRGIMPVPIFSFAVLLNWRSHPNTTETKNDTKNEVAPFQTVYFCFVEIHLDLIEMSWCGDFRMADASQSSARFRRTRSVSLSGDAEFVRLSNTANSQLNTGRKSSDYCGTKERWAASRLSLHHEFSRTFSSNCIDRYRGINGAAGDRTSLPRFSLSETDGVLHFNCLPDDCREHIFSFLTISERGIASQVALLQNQL